MILARRWMLALALVGGGCVIDGSLGKAESGADDTGGDTGTAGTMATSGADGATSAGTAGGEGEGGSGGGGSGGGSGDTGLNPLPTPDVACDPTAHDSDCATCRKGHCCTQLQACAAYEPCFCMWDCLLAPDHDAVVCAEHCQYDSQVLAELQTCTETMCATVCTDGLDAHPAHDGVGG